MAKISLKCTVTCHIFADHDHTRCGLVFDPTKMNGIYPKSRYDPTIKCPECFKECK